MQWQTVSEAKAKDRIEFGRRRVELMGRATPACDRSAPAAAVQAVACEGELKLTLASRPWPLRHAQTYPFSGAGRYMKQLTAQALEPGVCFLCSPPPPKRIETARMG